MLVQILMTSSLQPLFGGKCLLIHTNSSVAVVLDCTVSPKQFDNHSNSNSRPFSALPLSCNISVRILKPVCESVEDLMSVLCLFCFCFFYCLYATARAHSHTLFIPADIFLCEIIKHAAYTNNRCHAKSADKCFLIYADVMKIKPLIKPLYSNSLGSALLSVLSQYLNARLFVVCFVCCTLYIQFLL